MYTAKSAKTCTYLMLDYVKSWNDETTHVNTDLTESGLISVSQVHYILNDIQ